MTSNASNSLGQVIDETDTITTNWRIYVKDIDKEKQCGRYGQIGRGCWALAAAVVCASLARVVDRFNPDPVLRLALPPPPSSCSVPVAIWFREEGRRYESVATALRSLCCRSPCCCHSATIAAALLISAMRGLRAALWQQSLRYGDPGAAVSEQRSERQFNTELDGYG